MGISGIAGSRKDWKGCQDRISGVDWDIPDSVIREPDSSLAGLEILWPSFEKHYHIASRKRKSLWQTHLTKASSAPLNTRGIASLHCNRRIFDPLKMNK